MKAGDLIFICGSGHIYLVIDVEAKKMSGKNGRKKRAYKWVTVLEGEEGYILEEGLYENEYEIIDEEWDWPEYHIYYSSGGNDESI